MTTDRTSSPSPASTPRGLQRRKPAPLALEARIMFDGAAVATAAEAVKPVAAEAPVAHVAELGSVVAASQADSRSTAPADTAKAAPEAAKPVAAERATDGLVSTATKVLFVDSRVPDYQQIVAAAAADVKVVILDAEHDGVQQIADALEGMHDVASISIVSHGDSGLLLLGNTALHAGDMGQYQAQLSRIGSAMQTDGEILLYGCDVGAGTTGQSFIQSLADATGAVVAASTDSTGDVAHGGNWDLEIATGTLSSAPVLDVSKLANYDHTLVTTSVSTAAGLQAALNTAGTDNVDDIITLTGDILFISSTDAISMTINDGHKTTIVGAGHKIDGANLAQVLHISSGSGSVELNNLTITNGMASGRGGDSYDRSDAANFAKNVGGSGLGGGIYNAGTLTITNSSIIGNKATGGGGGGGHYKNTVGGAGGGGSGATSAGGAASGGTFNSTVTGPQTINGTAASGGTGGRGGALYYVATVGGAGGSTSGGGVGNTSAQSSRGGSGATATLNGVTIGGGAGGAGYNSVGAKGGDAAGAIYNVGTLVITGSTITGNLAAAGGGGGSGNGTNSYTQNAGAGGNGGNAYGGIWNNGGSLTVTTSNVSNNLGAGGFGGVGQGPGNSTGTVGVATSDAVAVPTIAGTSTGVAVNDNVGAASTVHPFANIVLTGSNSTVTIALDTAAKGTFTSASLTAAGFSTSNGGLTYTHASASVADLTTALKALVYQPAANRVAVGSTDTTTFTVTLNDGTQSATNNTTTVVSTSINDAPTSVGNLTLTATTEDTVATSINGSAISSLGSYLFSDPDVGAAIGGIAVIANTANATTEGVWQYSTNGTNWYAIGAVSDAASLMLLPSAIVRFVPVGDYNGTPPALSIRVVDSTNTSGYSVATGSETRVTSNTTTRGGATAVSSTINTLSTSVTAVNDTPSFTKGADQTVQEDANGQTFSNWATALNKGAANESGQALNFIVTNDNNALFSTQPSIDASGNLTFTPAANANGTTTVTVAIHDNGGGADTSATQTFTITINAVNDAPTGVGNLTLPTILEDTTAPTGTAISALTGLSFADVDAGASLGGLAIIANTANATTEGVWQYSSNGGTNWYAIGTVSDAASLVLSASTLVRFVPVADYNGTPPGLTVRAVDNTYVGGYSITAATQTPVTLDTSATRGGTTAVSANTNTVGIIVSSVNDAPTFVKGTDPTVLEDAGAQTLAGWVSNVVKGPANESSQGLTFTVSVTSGGALFSVLPSIDASGNLTFTPAANANGTATVSVTLRDSGGTANGGVDSSTQTFTIIITSVNDAPTGIPTLSGTTTEGQALSASTSSIVDVDGMVGVTLNHQWQVSADGTTGWTDITGATASTYTLAAAQVGQYVRDKVSFTDQGGTLETLVSAASAAVVGVVPQVNSITLGGATLVAASATSVTYNVTFNVPVTNVDISDFVVTGTSGAVGVVSAVSGSGTSYQVTVDTLSGDGTLRLDLNGTGTGIVSGSQTAIASGYTAGSAYTLDRTAPVVTVVNLPNTPLKVGDIQMVTITVGDDGGSPLTLVSGTVGGYTLGSLTRINSTTYAATFTVTGGGADVDASSDVPVSLVLSDPAGNRNIAFTIPISQPGDSINANAPTLLSLSNSSVQTASGANALVGVLSTTDASVGEAFTYALVSGAGDTNNAAFTIVNGTNLTVNDPAALGNGIYSVRIRTTDGGGNTLTETFAITVSTYFAPVAVADTASATEASGVANATAGANPVGNVLANDASSNTKTVTAIAGGTLGAARAGTYGSLTLNADGTYSYTVNNNNAAVQALRTNADTLTETFTYTMADNTAATSISTLTVTIHGANDAPSVATALTTQQVTVDTPLLFVMPVGTFADVDAGDTLTYTATLAGGAPLPAWLTFNGATRTFSGTSSAVVNLGIVVTATDLPAASVSNTFALNVVAAPVAGGGGGGTPTPPVVTPPVTTPTTPTTPTDPVTPTPPVVTTPVPVPPVTPTTPITPVTPEVPTVVTPVQIPDPQVPNTPPAQQPITAVQQVSLQSISNSVVETVSLPNWSANQMISESSSLRIANASSNNVISTTGFTPLVTGGAFNSSTGSYSPVNERFSALSPTPFSEFRRTLTDGGPGIFSVAMAPAGRTGLTVLNGMQDVQMSLGDTWSFSVPSDAFGHSDPQPGIVLKATLADGRALPAWLTFNSSTGDFEGTPPPGFKGELVIKVIARDSNGQMAEVTFRIKAQSEPTRAEVHQGRSGLTEQLRTAASRTALWVSGRT